MSVDLDQLLRANPDAPKSAPEVRQMVRQLYLPVQHRSAGGYGVRLSRDLVQFEANDSPLSEVCGEYSRGLIDLALASNLLDQAEKDEIAAMIRDAQPSLERQKTIGTFRLSWTEDSPDHKDNVTESDIDATAVELNALFERYSDEFRMPLADMSNGDPLIDIEVYFDSGLYGSTSSLSNVIFLNSRDVVRDECRRRTTAAHELFHRVEYAYGYVTGTAGQRWWVEALGSWSQKYAYPEQHDYVSRVQAGLNDPSRQLLSRSYDACHFWKYFGERLAAESDAFGQEFEAIRAFLEQHDQNGRNALTAARTVLTHLYHDRPFDEFFSDWGLVNFAKDFDNVPDGYPDNDVLINNCGRTFGPYPRILPAADRVIAADAPDWTSATQFVNRYGTDYFRFRIDPTVARVNIEVTVNSDGGDVELVVGLLLTLGEAWRATQSAFVTGPHLFVIDPPSDDIDGVVVAISGLSLSGGEYILSVNSEPHPIG